MSNFVIKPEKLNNKHRGYVLNTDLLEGFKTARRNNQQLLALEYAELIFDILNETMNDVKEDVKPTPKKSVSAKGDAANTEEA
jgi:hypothetical protein